VKKLIFVGLLLLGLALAAFLLSRPKVSDANQIFSVIDELKVAVERKNTQDIMNHISEAYHDSSNLTQRDLQLMSLQLARTGGNIKVNITDYTEPKITGKKAMLSLAAEIKYTEGGEITSSTGKIIFSFAKEKGKWKVIKAEGWQNWAGQAGLGYE
jgi:ketosteroid isomerase-like protein